MTAVADVAVTTVEVESRRVPALWLLPALGASLGGIGFSLAAANGVSRADGIRLGLIAAFAAAALLMLRRRSTAILGVIVGVGVVAAGVRSIAAAALEQGDAVTAAETIEPLAATMVVAAGFHLLVSLPDGRLGSRGRRNAVAAGYLVAGAVGALMALSQPDAARWPLGALAAVAVATGLVASNRRYLEARGLARQRLQWLGLALALVAETAILVLALRLLVDWPRHHEEVIAGSLVLVAVALGAGAFPRLVGMVDRTLSHAVSLAGLSALVVAVYLLIVIGLGRRPDDSERSILVLSMVAAGVSAALYLPARTWLSDVANRVVYGESTDPAEALDTFGARMTRALPMEELLLQLAELLHKHLSLAAAEVWTGSGGRLERVAGVPDRGPATEALGEKELAVVTRAGVTGRGWAAVWLPAFVEGRADAPFRLVPMTNSGELFGLILVERRPGDDEFTEEEEQVLTELARQVGLALKNSQLDQALQASLEEVRRKADELQESRARIVASGDAERRRIERNLHDGAQQHLVALAVKLRLVQQLAQRDLDQALVMLEQARGDALATIEEVRALAHGIYPPLLVDKGLPDALSAAAGRAGLPTSVAAEGLARYPTELEAAVYFCCLEALQNAGKHAGEEATATVTVVDRDGELCFEVRDDGRGFDLGERSTGHGFVNMADRLGAMGGTVEVWSAPDQGTRITGRIPLPDGDRIFPTGD